jgi:hypothetical protein
VFSTLGEGEGNSPIVGMHKKMTVEAEDPEQEVDKHEQGNSTPGNYSQVTGYGSV